MYIVESHDFAEPAGGADDLNDRRQPKQDTQSGPPFAPTWFAQIQGAAGYPPVRKRAFSGCSILWWYVQWSRRLDSSVRPPSAQWTTWCGTQRAGGIRQPGVWQRRSRRFSALCRRGDTDRELRPTYRTSPW